MRPLLIAILFVSLAPPASAQPAPSGLSGTQTHGSAVTVTGSSFGTKSTAAPRIWDNAEGTTVSTLWADRGPTGCSEGGTANIAYQTVIRTVALPHATSNTKYLAFLHCDSENGVGYVADVRTTGTYPNYSRWHWYWRMDPAWDNTGGENADGNNKFHTISAGTSLLSFPPDHFWYSEFDTRPLTSSTSPVNVDFSDTGQLGFQCITGTTTAGVCHSGGGTQSEGYGDNSNNPIAGWIHAELIIRWDRTSAGYVKYYENGVQYYGANGITDSDTGTTTRKEAIGLYARAREPNSYRYLDDIYFDWSTDGLAHVEICPGSTYAARGNCEPQILTAWSATSITFTANRAHFGASDADYLYVCDNAGSCNSAGLAFTWGGAGGGGTSGGRGKGKMRMRGKAPLVLAAYAIGFTGWLVRRRGGRP